jgi:hypothetical protein
MSGHRQEKSHHSRRSKTVLEALSVGMPLVAIPVTNDQRGVAVRVERTGTGEAIRCNRKLCRISDARFAACLKFPGIARRLNFCKLGSLLQMDWSEPPILLKKHLVWKLRTP